MPTYLYIKTHKITGLKYFGKTIKDPYTYNGSGQYWKRHLKKHGYDCETEILGFYENYDECKEAALKFSLINNIVESKEWANLMLEDGNTGGFIERVYQPLTEETKKKISETKKEQKSIPWNKGLVGSVSGNTDPKSEETKKKISESLKGMKRSDESIKKTADKLRGRKRPEISEMMKGREVSDETRKKISESQKGKVVTEETKEKIRKAREKQVITDETKEKLRGKVVVVNKNGDTLRIDKDVYYSQKDEGNNREYVFHRSGEGTRRKNKLNAVPIINNEEMKEHAKMRR